VPGLIDRVEDIFGMLSEQVRLMLLLPKCARESLIQRWPFHVVRCCFDVQLWQDGLNGEVGLSYLSYNGGWTSGN
jgi:hypothetical protein